MFKNANVTREDIGPFIRQYAEEHDILSKPRVMLLGSVRVVNILLATPLLRWYLVHGLVVDRVYQIIEYEPNPCFRRFCDSVSAARSTPDEDPDKVIIADTMKLLGNSSYGKRSPTLIDIVMLSTAPRSEHQRSSTTNGFDNWTSSPKTRTK